MKKSLLPLLLGCLLWGCTPAENPNPTPAVPSASESPAMIGSPTLQPDKTEGMTGRPDLPAEAFSTLTLLHAIRPEMREQETWWADSGIRDNRLAYYGSVQQPEAVAAMLKPYYEKPGYRPFVEGAPLTFSFDGAQLCVVRRNSGDVSQMYVLVPISEPPVEPQVLRDLKLPAVTTGELAQFKTLVVLATGQGLSDHMDHMLANAGFTLPDSAVATSTPPMATPIGDPYATPLTQNKDD